MLHYPLDFPSDAALLIVTNFRAGTIPAQRAATAEAAWNLVGYGLKSALGEDTANGVAKMGPELLSGDVPPDEEMISALEQHHALSPDKKLMGGLPISPQLLIKWGMGLAIRIISGMI